MDVEEAGEVRPSAASASAAEATAGNGLVGGAKEAEPAQVDPVEAAFRCTAQRAATLGAYVIQVTRCGRWLAHICSQSSWGPSCRKRRVLESRIVAVLLKVLMLAMRSCLCS